MPSSLPALNSTLPALRSKPFMIPAISVQNLGKMYRLNHQGRRSDSFREALTSAVTGPFRRFRQLSGRDETQEEFWALKDVSFEVQPGEVVGIIGRNGAGKSTLLKILSRIVDPSEGRVVLRGRVASLLEVGTGFHPELSGRENIYMNGSILGMKKREIDARFDEIVDFAEVEKFLDTPVKHYSSGMYVRLAFAVAAHLEPEILIVDEVLAVGDAEFQKKCLGKIKEVSTGTGRTVLFVSHNMAAVRSLCDRGIFLSSGRLIAIGTAPEIVDTYASAHIAIHANNLAELARPHGASMYMKRARLLVNGVPSTVAPMDSSVGIDVWFESRMPISNPQVLVVIHGQDGNRLLHTSNRFCQSIALAIPALSGTVSINMGQLPLTPGRYTISLHLELFGVSQHSVIDALIIDVEGRDVLGSGWIPHPSNAPVWWRANYKIAASDGNESPVFDEKSILGTESS